MVPGRVFETTGHQRLKRARALHSQQQWMRKTNMGHHLILGELEDYLTGEILADTADERFRQEIARLLVEEKGYGRAEIAARRKLSVNAGPNSAVIPVDFVVSLQGRICMVVRFGPGSVVTRQRSTLAAARLIAGQSIPVVVVTNGQTADILDGTTGKRIGEGLAAVPRRSELAQMAERHRFEPISTERLEKEARIVYAFEVDGACPCDDTICRMDPSKT